jgi:hypothetical protein
LVFAILTLPCGPLFSPPSPSSLLRIISDLIFISLIVHLDLSRIIPVAVRLTDVITCSALTYEILVSMTVAPRELSLPYGC